MSVPAHYVRVFAAANINSAVANGELLQFDTIYYDSNGFAPAVGSFNTIVIPAGLGGVYLINGWSSTTANQSTTMGLGILINGSASFSETNQSISGPGSVTYTLDLGAVSVLLLNDGDTVGLINNSVSPGPNAFNSVTLALARFGSLQPDTSPRTITQIAVSSGAGGQPDALYALADDGTVWRLSLKLHQAVWYMMPPLPVGTSEPLPLLVDTP